MREDVVPTVPRMRPVSDDDLVVEQLRALLAQEAADAEDLPSTGGWLQRMCRVATRDLPASGVGVSLLSDGGELMTTAASSAATALVEELQFSLGEGPCLLAHATRAPVLVPDLSELARTSWPGYAPAAHDHGVRAVFAFPLQVGATRLGAMDVYRNVVGDLSGTAQSRALGYAELAVESLLHAGSTVGGASALLDDGAGTPYEVYQAQGMVMVQLGVPGDVALARLRAHAYAEGQRLVEVAQDVLDRRLVLQRDDP